MSAEKGPLAAETKASWKDTNCPWNKCSISFCHWFGGRLPSCRPFESMNLARSGEAPSSMKKSPTEGVKDINSALLAHCIAAWSFESGHRSDTGLAYVASAASKGWHSEALEVQNWCCVVHPRTPAGWSLDLSGIPFPVKGSVSMFVVFLCAENHGSSVGL